MRKYFELTKPYKFMVDDLTAGIYLVCAMLGICTTINITPLFLLGYRHCVLLESKADQPCGFEWCFVCAEFGKFYQNVLKKLLTNDFKYAIISM